MNDYEQNGTTMNYLFIGDFSLNESINYYSNSDSLHAVPLFIFYIIFQ